VSRMRPWPLVVGNHTVLSRSDAQVAFWRMGGRPISMKDEYRLFAFQKPLGGRRSFVADDREAALLEHADRGFVVCRHAGVKRAARVELQHQFERARCHTLAPVLPGDSVTDHFLAFCFEAADVAGNPAIDQDGFGNDLGIAQDFQPMRVEGFRTTRHYGSQSVRLGVALVAEQCRDIVRAQISQLDGKRDSLEQSEALPLNVPA
jgi:hypothetical protein